MLPRRESNSTERSSSTPRSASQPVSRSVYCGSGQCRTASPASCGWRDCITKCCVASSTLPPARRWSTTTANIGPMSRRGCIQINRSGRSSGANSSARARVDVLDVEAGQAQELLRQSEHVGATRREQSLLPVLDVRLGRRQPRQIGRDRDARRAPVPERPQRDREPELEPVERELVRKLEHGAGLAGGQRERRVQRAHARRVLRASCDAQRSDLARFERLALVGREVVDRDRGDVEVEPGSFEIGESTAQPREPGAQLRRQGARERELALNGAAQLGRERARRRRELVHRLARPVEPQAVEPAHPARETDRQRGHDAERDHRDRPPGEAAFAAASRVRSPQPAERDDREDERQREDRRDPPQDPRAGLERRERRPRALGRAPEHASLGRAERRDQRFGERSVREVGVAELLVLERRGRTEHHETAAPRIARQEEHGERRLAGRATVFGRQPIDGSRRIERLHPRVLGARRERVRVEAKLVEPRAVEAPRGRRVEEQRAVRLFFERTEVLVRRDRATAPRRFPGLAVELEAATARIADEVGRRLQPELGRDGLDRARVGGARDARRPGLCVERQPVRGAGEDDAAAVLDEYLERAHVLGSGALRVDPDEQVDVGSERGGVGLEVDPAHGGVALGPLGERARVRTRDRDARRRRLGDLVEIRADQVSEIRQVLGAQPLDPRAPAARPREGERRVDLRFRPRVVAHAARAERRDALVRDPGRELGLVGRVDDVEVEASVGGRRDLGQHVDDVGLESAQLGRHPLARGDVVRRVAVAVERGEALGERRLERERLLATELDRPPFERGDERGEPEARERDGREQQQRGERPARPSRAARDEPRVGPQEGRDEADEVDDVGQAHDAADELLEVGERRDVLRTARSRPRGSAPGRRGSRRRGPARSARTPRRRARSARTRRSDPRTRPTTRARTRGTARPTAALRRSRRGSGQGPVRRGTRACRRSEACPRATGAAGTAPRGTCLM